MRSWLRAFLLAVSAWGASMAAGQAAEPTFTVAVVPQFAPVRVYQDWQPLLDRLEQVTGYHFKLLTYAKISDFEAALLKGVPDLAYVNPYDMVMARQEQGYRPLVRDSRLLNGILVVRRDSPITALSQLEGKTLAFPAANAFGASLLIRVELADKHLDIRPEYVGSHQNVYRAVALGEAAAGGGIKETLAREPAALQSQLRILYTTPGVPPHPLAASPRVTQAEGQKIVAALLALRGTAEGRRLLGATFLNDPVRADFARDYAPLEKLGIQRFIVNPAP